MSHPNPEVIFGTCQPTARAFRETVTGHGFQPFSYLEDGGDTSLVYAIKPTPGENGHPSSLGTAPIPWHTDNSFLDRRNRPDWLWLLSIHNPGQTYFAIADVHQACDRLSHKALSYLFQDIYSFAIPHSFSRGGLSGCIEDQSVLQAVNGRVEVACNLGLTSSGNEAGQASLDAFKLALDAVAVPVFLEPGQYIGFNNRRYLHRRGTPTPNRLLLRIYGQRCIEQVNLKAIDGFFYSVN